MNTFQAECFLALSKSLNFTQTAEIMYISQPTLSRNIAALEEEIGVQLLIRTAKSVELTAAGKAFAASCGALLETYHRGIEASKQAREGVTGILTLGIQQDAFEPFVVDLVRMFQTRCPQIQLRLKPMSLSQLLQALNSGALDFIVAAGSTNLKRPGRLLLSGRQECAVLPVDHPLANEESLRMIQLTDEAFIAMSPTSSIPGHYLLLKYASDAGFTPNIVAVADCVPAVMMLTACGVGVSVLYQDLCANAHDRVKFVPLMGVDPFKRWLMWDRDSRNPAVPALIQCAEAYRLSAECP